MKNKKGLMKMKEHAVTRRTPVFRVVAWVNIVTQLLFPVAASLTPIWVTATPNSQTQSKLRLAQAQTQPYRLKAGETPASVAKGLGMSVSELQKLNQFRTFSKPFNALKGGDEIDIPRADGTFYLEAPRLGDEGYEQQTAQYATQTANALKSGDPTGAAVDQLRGLATDKATQEIQDWLKGYGTARVKLGVDDKANLEGSEFDLLLPLYDTQNQMTYTQLGLRHVDKRTTTNVGLGQRLFLDSNNMLGYNAFLDHDITGKHTRMGLGAEYWRDYLKLGANGYFRLSGWRDAHNLEGYDARPANGFDIRGEGYLPAYPQLGGKLMYEQYFGDEVGLFGKNKRQKDPSAVTVGVNYTPFPLLTLGVERRQGTDHGGDTQFNLGLKYEIGTPWAKQVDTNAVDKLRSLAGSRYDLVERNNQIVLEYRKQETIRLALASHISGRAGETKSLGVNATATKGVRNIEWQAASLLANGGKIIETSPGQYGVILPAWHANGQNSYMVTGIAYDNDGKASSPASAQVTVSSAAISAQNTTFTAEPNRLPPDGKSTSTLTLTVKDAEGNPVPGQADRLTLDITGDSDITPSAVKEVSPGVYELTVTAGTTTGTSTLTPVIDGVSLKPVVMTIGTPADVNQSTFTANPAQLPPDGKSTSTLTLTVKDADGNPISGQADKLKLDVSGDGDVQTTTAKEVAPGVYELTVTAGTTPGTTTITPIVDGVSLTPVVMTIEGHASAANSTFTANPDVLPANGQGTSTLTLTVKDADGNPVPGQAESLKLNVSGDGDVKLSPATEIAPGVYQVVLTAGNTEGTATITPVVEGVTLNPVVMTLGSANAPTVSALHLTGQLAVGETLAANYHFEAGIQVSKGIAAQAGAALTDQSTYAWGDKGQTAGRVTAGQTITTSGSIPGYTLVTADVGKVKEVSVQAKNNLNVAGNIVTLATDASKEEGNDTNGGDNGGGEHGGQIIDPAAQPKISTLSLKGSLAVGQALSATYDFDANRGDGKDASTYAWGDKGSTAANVSAGQTIVTTGEIPSYTLVAADVGKVKEVSAQAKNSLGVTGNTATLATDASQAEGNETTGGDEHGGIIDPTGSPQVSDLQLRGELAVGNALDAQYTFAANGGNAQDKSTYAWGDKGSTAANVSAGQTVETSGTVPSYTLVSADVGKVKEVSVHAKNGQAVEGNIVTLATDASKEEGNDTNGGDNGGGEHGGQIIDPAAQPKISTLSLKGSLAVGQALSATYDFDANRGDGKDASTYAWGDKGSTAANVSAGQTIVTTGEIPSYTLVAGDVGKVKEVSAQAKNSLGVTGNTATLATDASQADGNDTHGGSDGKIVAPSFDHITVNGYNFAPDSGFPKTGFAQATFTLALNNAQPSDYNWQSSASWVAVDGNGKVTFPGKPTGQEAVTITATPKSGEGETLSHTFTLEQWFVYNDTKRNWSDSNSYCQGLGMSLPTRAQLTNSTVIYPANNASRAVNTVWSEWGNISSYGFGDNGSWTSDAASGSGHYYVGLPTGYVLSLSDSYSNRVMCHRGL